MNDNLRKLHLQMQELRLQELQALKIEAVARIARIRKMLQHAQDNGRGMVVQINITPDDNAHIQAYDYGQSCLTAPYIVERVLPNCERFFEELEETVYRYLIYDKLKTED